MRVGGSPSPTQPLKAGNKRNKTPECTTAQEEFMNGIVFPSDRGTNDDVSVFEYRRRNSKCTWIKRQGQGQGYSCTQIQTMACHDSAASEPHQTRKVGESLCSSY